MAFVHGKGSYFAADNGSGTLKDLSAFTTNVDGFPGTTQAEKTTTYGQSAETYIAGLKDAQIKVSGQYDSTATSGPDDVLSSRVGAAPQTITYGPEGNSSGKVSYTAEAIMTEYSINDPVGGVITWSATFQVTGGVTRGTF
ncbi:MAG TPA: hypothetical protein VHL53_16035 [Acidimicrobiia bacterium]|nr:hypothetical protein [Acidimicrobiia bacterium]